MLGAARQIFFGAVKECNGIPGASKYWAERVGSPLRLQDSRGSLRRLLARRFEDVAAVARYHSPDRVLARLSHLPGPGLGQTA